MKESPNPTFALSSVQLQGGALHTGSAVTGLDFLPRRLQSSFEVSWRSISTKFAKRSA